MEETSTKTDADGTALFAGTAWFDPIEAGIRDRVRGRWCTNRDLEALAVGGRGV